MLIDRNLVLVAIEIVIILVYVNHVVKAISKDIS